MSEARELQEFACCGLSYSLEVLSHELLHAPGIGQLQHSLYGFDIDSMRMGGGFSGCWWYLCRAAQELVEPTSGVYECDIRIWNYDRCLLEVLENPGHCPRIVGFGLELYDCALPVRLVGPSLVLDNDGLILLDMRDFDPVLEVMAASEWVVICP